MSADRTDVVFISWAPFCSRSDGIARKLNGISLMIYAPEWGSHWWTVGFKYAVQGIRTLRALIKYRPTFVLVMAPPIVACLPVYFYCRLSGARYAIDSHTAAFLYEPWKSLLFVHRFFSRRAATTMVTNSYLGGIVRSWGAPILIVRDVPIEFPAPEFPALVDGAKMVLVNTFTDDEPLQLFLAAAAKVPDVHFYVTGDTADASPEILRRAPANVTFTGFVPKAVYAGLLTAADAVISLTTLDHTMQRGAYEAVYMGKPVVTSNFKVLREAFDSGAVHVDNSVASIVAGIGEMRRDIERYAAEVLVLKQDKLARWREVESRLRTMMGERRHGRVAAPASENTK